MEKKVDMGNKLDISRICDHIEELVSVPGPTGLVAKVSPDDCRLGVGVEFPMVAEVSRIVEEINQESGTHMVVIQDFGNIIVLTRKLDIKQIMELPVAIASHIDEVTFSVSQNHIKGNPVLIPQFKRPFEICHDNVRAFGFRSTAKGRELAEVAKGTISLIKNTSQDYFPHTLPDVVLQISEGAVEEGDVVLQDYGPFWYPKREKQNAVLHAKALDDRVGVISSLYALMMLAKERIDGKAIITAYGEGIPESTNWCGTTKQLFRRYCRTDGITIVCDVIDGASIDSHQKSEHLTDAFTVPYSSMGKGGGDYGVFSYLRREVKDLAEKAGFSMSATSDYLSRSISPAIMDDFPLIGYICWTNGEPGNLSARSHFDESVDLRRYYFLAFLTWVLIVFQSDFQTVIVPDMRKFNNPQTMSVMTS